MAVRAVLATHKLVIRPFIQVELAGMAVSSMVVVVENPPIIIAMALMERQDQTAGPAEMMVIPTVELVELVEFLLFGLVVMEEVVSLQAEPAVAEHGAFLAVGTVVKAQPAR